MGRLARDARGNTLAMMAAALIPLAGMVGGGIDMSRMYIAKTRLQHACDAGALAGRKNMGAGSWGADDNATALQYFDANYAAGLYGTGSLARAFSESGGTVSGTASAILPMTLTRVIGQTTQTLAVSCSTTMQLPNTDVMFVLDTTGSMNCVASDTSCTNNNNVPASGSKIVGLKNAVKCFYEAVAQAKTNGTCSTSITGLPSSVQVRFGFVPYSSNVNVGYLLPPAYFASSWKYQSREPQWTTNYNGTKTFNRWHYGQIATDISGLKNGSSWNTSFTAPIGSKGTNQSVTWDGCIEERQTVQATSYTPIPSAANDLNIDLVPTSSDSTTLWAPALEPLIYMRNITNSYGQATTADTYSTTDYYGTPGYTCPTASQKMQAWSSVTAFDTYVDSLTAQGNTYHDIGILWGARLMSPTGIFASENALAANGGTINRNMIFMTDGDSTSSPCDYNAYGMPWWDQRQTTDVGPASGCGTNRQALIDQINLRYAALCTAVKNKGINLYVISYGNGSSTDTETRLAACASAGSYYKATDSTALQSAFTAIAAKITMLRLTA